jgi:hypothetical protein
MPSSWCWTSNALRVLRDAPPALSLALAYFRAGAIPSRR